MRLFYLSLLVAGLAACNHAQDKKENPTDTASVSAMHNDEIKYIAIDSSKIDNKKDPYCEMNVVPTEVVDTAQYKGKTLAFCSAECKAAFVKEPEKYIAKAQLK